MDRDRPPQAEIGERWIWNIASVRSLCSIVRQLPTTMPALRECWGFGGGGVRAERHGAFLLAALPPHVAALQAVHEAAREAAQPASEKETKPRGKRSAAAAARDTHEEVPRRRTRLSRGAGE